MSSVLPTTTTTTNNSQQNNPILYQTPLPPPSNTTNYNYPVNPTTHYYNNKVVNNGGNYNAKKRSLDDSISRLHNSSYFKMRLLLSQLRPLFIQARDAPDFDNNEARFAIQEKLKLMVDLCRQEAASQANNGSGTHDMASEKPGWQCQDIKPAVQHRQENRFAVGSNAEKQMHGNHRIPGSYIVGGSAFGWNFLMFHGPKPEYYGRTKEAFRTGR